MDLPGKNIFSNRTNSIRATSLYFSYRPGSSTIVYKKRQQVSLCLFAALSPPHDSHLSPEYEIDMTSVVDARSWYFFELAGELVLRGNGTTHNRRTIATGTGF